MIKFHRLVDDDFINYGFHFNKQRDYVTVFGLMLGSNQLYWEIGNGCSYDWDDCKRCLKELEEEIDDD